MHRVLSETLTRVHFCGVLCKAVHTSSRGAGQLSFLGCLEVPVVGRWMVLKANLVLRFGPNHDFGFAFRLGPS